MPLTQTTIMLIAQGRIEALNHGFREQQSNSNTVGLIMLAIAVIAVASAAAIAWIVKRRSECEINDPTKLLHELCKNHQLSRSDCKLLRQFAEARGLKDPCQIMLNEQLWTLDPAEDKKFCKQKTRSQLTILQRQLFTAEQHSAVATSG